MLYNTPFVVVLLILIATIIFIVKGIRVIQQAEVIVIERLGKYYKTLSSGMHIIIPVLDKPRRIIWKYQVLAVDGHESIRIKEIERIDIREQVYDFSKQNVITKDNVTIEIDALLYFQIVDPVRAIYEIDNLPNAIEKLAQTTLRNVIGELDLDASLVSRDTVNSKLTAILDEATDKWGVKVNRVELKDITPPMEIQNAMEQQMKAERNRRAKILEAEGLKQSAILESEGIKIAKINKAEANKQAAILEAEGVAATTIKKAEAEKIAIEQIVSVLSKNDNPEHYLIAIKYIEALKEMVEGKDNKVVYLPYEATGILGSIGSIKDLFGAGK